MKKRFKMSRRQNKKNFYRGNKINRRNLRIPVVQRGGYRI